MEKKQREFGPVKIGRGQSKLVEQAELTAKREYLFLWKKQIVDPNKLAKLYQDQGLTQIEIARRYKIRRATISVAVKRFKPTLIEQEPYRGHYKICFVDCTLRIYVSANRPTKILYFSYDGESFGEITKRNYVVFEVYANVDDESLA